MKNAREACVNNKKPILQRLHKKKILISCQSFGAQNYFQTRAGTRHSSVTLKFNFCKNGIVDLRGLSQENINLWKCISNKQSFLFMR
jgi:hypothetical protein